MDELGLQARGRSRTGLATFRPFGLSGLRPEPWHWTPDGRWDPALVRFGHAWTMARVEWTRLEGNDIEAVVAMFVNRERPRSVRITPSIGDGGVDILDPGGIRGSDDVYQIKKYTAPLTSRQKAEIDGSLKSLTTDERWEELRLGAWHLVTPWDPTPEAYRWFAHVVRQYKVDGVWHGLAYVEQLAARYPDVINYYLHGGVSRIEAALQTVLALDRLDRSPGEGLDVPRVIRRIESALPSLDNDPHYRYELRFGEGQPQAASERPGLVMTSIMGRSGGGRWAAVDVIARCAASTDVRPITINGAFTINQDDPFAAVLQDFFDFGVPFTSPKGVYVGEIDAPGGLGGRLEGGTLTSFPASPDLGDNPELHFEVLDSSGCVLASTDMTRVERSQGAAGVRVVLEEVHGLFSIEDRYNLRERRGRRNVTVGDLSGAPIAAVHAALTFLLNCRPPNIGRISVRHTPPERGVADPHLGFAWPEEFAARLEAMVRLTEELLTIQQSTSKVVRMPALADMPPHQFAGWRFAARILRGEEVTGVYPDGHQLLLEVADDVPDPDPDGSLTISVPLGVEIGSEFFALGRAAVTLDRPTLLGRTSHADRVVLALTTPDRSFRYRQIEAGDRQVGDHGRGT